MRIGRPPFAGLPLDVGVVKRGDADEDAGARAGEAFGNQAAVFKSFPGEFEQESLEGVFLEGVRGAFSGGITLGRDGTRISLPRGCDVIDVSQP